MASLVDKSLVQQVEQKDGEVRFTMLETIREYGLDRLAASGEKEVTQRAHAAYCIVLAEVTTRRSPRLRATPTLPTHLINDWR
jgi:predicted ATPase